MKFTNCIVPLHLGDTLPIKDRDVFFKTMEKLPIMDTVTPLAGGTGIDIGLSNVNPVLHVPATLLITGAVDHWGILFGDKEVYYEIYKHGFSVNVAKVKYAFYREECTIANKMGVGIQPTPRAHDICVRVIQETDA